MPSAGIGEFPLICPVIMWKITVMRRRGGRRLQVYKSSFCDHLSTHIRTVISNNHKMLNLKVSHSTFVSSWSWSSVALFQLELLFTWRFHQRRSKIVEFSFTFDNSIGFLISWMNLIVNTSDLELVPHEMVDFQDFQCLILKCIEHTFHML